MKKLLKYSLLGIAGVVALLVLAAAIISATFNPNDYKPLIIKLVQEKKQRTLNIEGDIKLAFWPKIGANLGKVSISEHKSDKQFASIQSAKVALAVLPLLKKQLVVDTIYIDGANANIIKYKDGSTNFDDLLSKDDEESQDIKFDVDGVKVSNSAVTYTDEGTGAKYALSKFNLSSGHIALAEPVDLATDFTLVANQPVISASAKLKGNFLVDPETKHFAAKGLDALIKGDLLGGKDVEIMVNGDVDAKPEAHEFLIDSLKLAVSGQFNGAKLNLDLSAPKLVAQKDEVTGKKVTVSISQDKAGDTFKANLVLADIKGSPKALQSSGITGDIAGVQGKRTINGKFSSPFNGNLENLIFDLPKLAGNLDIKDPSLPSGALQGRFDLSLHADVKNELVNSKFNLNIDDTKLNGDVAVASFKKPNIKFNLNADKLNLNKLIVKSNQPATKSSDKPAQENKGGLSALKNILLDGKLNVGSILYEKYQVSGLNVNIKADGEKLALTGLNVKLDDSRIKGSVGVSHFAHPLYTFDIDIDQLDVDKYVSDSSKPADSKASDKPLDLSALKALNADGSLRIGNLKYGKTKASNIRIDLKADGQKLSLNPVAAKVDDSQINANIGITRFSDPIYSFNVNIDKLDADKYITKSDQPVAKSTGDTPIDLSALKKLNASGDAKVGWLKLANVTTQNVNIGLKADNGLVTVSPFSANLYQGSMNGILKVDARATPNISFKQDMKGIAIGPLLVDAINNDMLDGKGTLNVDVSTSGNSVTALKKALNGKAAVNLADGAIKGVDIAGTIRDIKSKATLFKDKSSLGADQSKKTDFSELTASFDIKNGVAHNEDLAMKAPILRLAKGDSRGEIDIGKETINYLAKPTVVKSLKGQGGADLDTLAGLSIPVKITGTFSAPKYGMDFAAIGAAVAKSKLLDQVGGEKSGAIKELLGGGDKADALQGLLGKKKPAEAAPSETSEAPTAPAEAPKSVEDQAKEKAAEKLKKLLKF
ncbi:MAG: AsmA family protein [Methylotenera sp.]|nr:AsmA family protein [Methylotenera sp.]MDP2403032.1 AsmA family protein [Methylotenera sp.]MDP3096075.1 AsmA family protein [Methylotenera sp.]MDZ4222990.1 AsmA family protein [Methylotenera sp.]